MSSENNKRIARNTLMLYFRMLLIMAVSLYTVRVVLRTLGVVDYGINNVVGGIVGMFAFLSGTMASASQRFFSFYLGKGDFVQLKRTFSLTVTSYSILSLAILILAETIGIWFLNTRLVIPAERIIAANWIYQFSILSCIVTIMTIPYDAAIIAHEDMSIYAYVSILDAFLRLIIVYVLVLSPTDKLKLYALLTFITTCIITFIYRTTCIKKYKECHYKFYWDKGLFYNLMNYSGWNLFGTLSSVLKNQGINILLNMFFGPVINAARAVAYQINNAVNQFVVNFFIAVRPQITKHYAADEKAEMLNLVFKSSKYSSFLLLFISMPILLETNFLLTLWLKNVPEYVVLFSRLVVISVLIDSLSNPLVTAALATGKIMKYQLIVGTTELLNLPISFLFLKIGYPPQVTMYIAIIVSIICLFLRLWILKGMIGLSILKYLKKVLIIILAVCTLSYILPIFLYFRQGEGFIRFITVSCAGITTSLIAIFYIGLSKSERSYIIQQLINKVNYIFIK